MKRFYVYLFIIFWLSLCACSKEVDTSECASSTQEVLESNHFGEVSLSDVPFPRYGSAFLRLYGASVSFNVSWGELGSESAFCWVESGFPGFDVPIIIECNTEIEASAIILETTYGKFTYSWVDKKDCFEENRNLIDKETGNRLIDFGVAVEKVFLWFPEKGYVGVYQFVDGTKVTF